MDNELVTFMDFLSNWPIMKQIFFIIIINLPISELSLVVDFYTKFYSSNSKFSVPA